MAPQHRLLSLLLLLLSAHSSLSRLPPSPAPLQPSTISLPPSWPPSAAPAPSPVADPSPATESFSDQPSLFDDLQTGILSISSTGSNFGFDLSSSLKASGPDPLVSNICDNTDHPPLCLATIRPFLATAASSVDVESVLRFAVEAGGDYAKEALSVATNLVSKSDDITPELRSTLKDCKESYDVAVENFQKTLDAFTTKDVGTMRSVLSAVITFVGDCEDEFAEMQAPSPLSGYAEKLTDMTSNCLAIVSQMMN